MSLETIKCPHCGYIYLTEIERKVKDGEIVAVRRLKDKINSKPSKEMYIDQKCPSL